MKLSATSLIIKSYQKVRNNMPESEAIEKLKNMRLYMQIQDESNDCKFTEDDYKANKMAIQALEKQIPKKPNKTIDSSWGVKKEVHVCPVCDYYLTEVHFIAPQKIESNKKITYCETCGQAIDWSDEE